MNKLMIDRMYTWIQNNLYFFYRFEYINHSSSSSSLITGGSQEESVSSVSVSISVEEDEELPKDVSLSYKSVYSRGYMVKVYTGNSYSVVVIV